MGSGCASRNVEETKLDYYPTSVIEGCITTPFCKLWITWFNYEGMPLFADCREIGQHLRSFANFLIGITTTWQDEDCTKVKQILILELSQEADYSKVLNGEPRLHSGKKIG